MLSLITYLVTCSFVSSRCKKIKDIPKLPGCFHLVSVRYHHQLFSAFQLLLQEWSSKAFLTGTHRVSQLILMPLARAHSSGTGMTSQRSISSLSAWTCQGLSTFLALLCDGLEMRHWKWGKGFHAVVKASTSLSVQSTSDGQSSESREVLQVPGGFRPCLFYLCTVDAAMANICCLCACYLLFVEVVLLCMAG